MDTRVLVSVILDDEHDKLGLECQYTKAIDKFKSSYYVSKISLICELANSSSDYFVFVKYANVINLSTLEIEAITIEDCIRYNVLGLNMSQSDLCDDGYMPINLFGYSESLCENIDEDDCIPFVYDGEPIKIGGG